MQTIKKTSIISSFFGILFKFNSLVKMRREYRFAIYVCEGMNFICSYYESKTLVFQ
jgi:hypothetical protein